MFCAPQTQAPTTRLCHSTAAQDVTKHQLVLFQGDLYHAKLKLHSSQSPRLAIKLIRIGKSSKHFASTNKYHIS